MTSLSTMIARIFSNLRPASKPSVQNHRGNHAPNKHGYAISSLKTFDEFALDARATLNAGYNKIGMLPSESFSDSDWCVAGLDILPRRAIFAIASNHCGLFSEYEIAAARQRMERRQQRAMQAVNPFRLEHRQFAMLQAAVKYLAAAGPEEKASQEWKTAMMDARAACDEHMRDKNQPADIDCHNSLAA